MGIALAQKPEGKAQRSSAAIEWESGAASVAGEAELASSLIATMYDAALAPEQWPDVLAQCRDFCRRLRCLDLRQGPLRRRAGGHGTLIVPGEYLETVLTKN